jgi:hypothetical protein
VEVLQRAIDRLTSARDTVYSMYRGYKDLDPKILKESLEYYDEFFKLAANSKSWDREMRVNCNR